jgi:hypothetical protein
MASCVLERICEKRYLFGFSTFLAWIMGRPGLKPRAMTKPCRYAAAMWIKSVLQKNLIKTKSYLIIPSPGS